MKAEAIRTRKFTSASHKGIIVSGLRMARLVTEHGLQAAVSSMCGVYNSNIAGCYIRRGVKRIILPRGLSLGEMEDICKGAPDAEYEDSIGAHFFQSRQIAADPGLHMTEE